MTIKRRRRFEQTMSLTERLHQFADEARNKAARLPQGKDRDLLIRKVEMTDKAAELEGWLSSRELRPPR